jgi:chitinase
MKIENSSRKFELCVVLVTFVLLASTSRLQAQVYGITDLGTLPGTSKSVAYALNNLGQAVGVSSNPTADIATLFSNGAITNLNTLGADVSVATSIGGSGQVVGYNFFGAGAFLYSNGKMVSLGVPPGATSSYANAINGTGQIAGVIYLASGPSHAALYSNGVWTDLGAFPGAAGTSATGINTANQIVGTAVFPVKSYHPFRPGKHVGFIYRNGVLVDLNALIPANSGFTITDAAGINDSGQILCTATNTAASAHAVLLNPK